MIKYYTPKQVFLNEEFRCKTTKVTGNFSIGSCLFLYVDFYKFKQLLS